MNRKSEMEQKQIIDLWKAGFSGRKISETLAFSRDAVGKYLKAAGIRLSRGRPKQAISRREVPTDSSGSDVQTRPLTVPKCPPTPVARSQCETHRALIEDRVAKGMNGQVIFQDLVDELSFTGSYDSVKRFVRKLRKKQPEVFAVIPTFPGKEGQVDYGRGAPTKHPVTGKYRRPWLFSMKLSHSRKAFRRVAWKSSSEVWCQLHEAAFRHFGGVPETIVLDNLKEGVIKPDIYDPQLNPLYATFLEYYGSVALPCRVATPRHKGKVESDIKYTQNTLKGRRFEAIEEQQKFLDDWDARWANTRIHGTIKRQVKEIFESEEKPALRPLPAENFPVLRIVKRKVHPDGCVAIDDTYYSAPHQWVGQELVVQVGRLFVDLIHPSTGERIARHGIQGKGRYVEIPEHKPDKKRLDKTHEWLLKQAQGIGVQTHQMVDHLLTADPHHNIRKAQGLLSFSRTHRPEHIEKASGLCILNQTFNYPSFKLILQRLHSAPAAAPLTQTHELIRSITDYQTLWQSTTASNINEGEKNYAHQS